MSSYGLTDKGFVLKRMDTIMEQVHADLSEGFGFDTRMSDDSFLNVLVTSFCGEMADVWEVAQDDYYSKYPTTAMGINLDNAVQFGGVRRKQNSQSLYQLHCTGDDGTAVRKNTVVASDTNPEVRLYAGADFTITRENCNAVNIKVAAAQADAVYTVGINGVNYSYVSVSDSSEDILNGLKAAITDTEYIIDVTEGLLSIQDADKSRSNAFSLTENLTTNGVTSIAIFYTEEYGKIILPYGVVTKMVNNISGFYSVTNQIDPIYGRLEETDIELRQSYIARSALRSNTMIESIVAELLNNVAGVETASGHENYKDVTDERGLPPHSIEIIVEGGQNNDIASAILRKKAGGIQTYGSEEVAVTTSYGDVVPIRFNRPEQLYTWIKVVLHGDTAKIPKNYVALAKDSIVADTEMLIAGDSLLTQLLHDGLYGSISGVTFIDIYTATSTDAAYVPEEADYALANVEVGTRQRIVVDDSRIEVSLYGS